MNKHKHIPTTTRAVPIRHWSFLIRHLARAALVLASSALSSPGAVNVERVPDGGLQPQTAVDLHGGVHLIYFKGEAKAGDLFYRRRLPGAKAWSEPMRVNSQPGSAIAMGTIRGGQLAVGRNGRVHVAWNGSSQAEPKAPEGVPMLYTRLDSAGTSFEPQRNLMHHTRHLDGGGSIAADAEGRVHVVFHASALEGKADESTRAVYLATSTNDGSTFAPERRALDEMTGACACCGLRAWSAGPGTLYVAFRAAREKLHRDMTLLTSQDSGATFVTQPLGSWLGTVCPMSSAAGIGDETRIRAAWEIAGRIHLGGIVPRTGKVLKSIEPAGDGQRKHPSLAINRRGETLLAWTEGTGWNRGGRLAWQIFDRDDRPTGAVGTAPGVPAWSFAAAVAEGERDFILLY